MRDSGLQVGYAHHQLKHAINNHKIFGRYAYGYQQHIDTPVGKHQPESEQNGEYTAGSSDYGAAGCYHVDDGRPNSRCKIIQGEGFGTPNRFDGGSENPQGEHVEKNMKHAAVQKHVCNQLPGPEHAAFNREKGKIEEKQILQGRRVQRQKS